METSVSLSSTKLPVAVTHVVTSLETTRVSSTAQQAFESTTISPRLVASTTPLPSLTTSAVKESDRSSLIYQSTSRELNTFSISAIPSPDVQTTSSPLICSVTVTQSPICESNSTNICNSNCHMSMTIFSCS